jgi:hypothetical protein
MSGGGLAKRAAGVAIGNVSGNGWNHPRSELAAVPQIWWSLVSFASRRWPVRRRLCEFHVYIADEGGMFRGVVGKGVGKNLGELFDGVVLGVAKGGKWGGRIWMLQCLNEVLNGLGSGIGGRELRNGHGGGKEFHRVSELRLPAVWGMKTRQQR